jgi:translocation and assembly module TamB
MIMKRRTRWPLFAGSTLAGLVALGLLIVLIGSWAVPALIVARIQSHYRGKVSIRDWWADGKSAGVVGLVLHEDMGSGSVAWATADRVSTDLSLGALIRGRFTPRRVTIEAPRLSLRLDRNGRPLTRIPLVARDDPATSFPPLPAVSIKGARVTVRQEGRPEMVVVVADAQLVSDPSGITRLSAGTKDPAWGRWDARGEFSPGFRTGHVRLAGRGIEATPEKEACLPFVPVEVWKNVAARGPLDVRLDVRLTPGTPQPFAVRTEITLRRSAVTLPNLGLDAAAATGTVAIEDGVVTLDRVAGRALGGDVETAGTLDFSRQPPRLDLLLGLDRVRVADSPRAWQLDRTGLSGGLMSGKARVRAALTPDTIDLTGTTGDAQIHEATLQGLPVKSLRLVLRAEGADLHYETEAGTPPDPRADGDNPAVDRVADAPSGGGDPSRTPPSRVGHGIQLPRSFSTVIDLEGVELSTIAARAALLRIRLPIDLAGRFSLKARATIPLGALTDVKAYLIHGRATLEGASVAGVDVGHASAAFDLADGTLELTEFQGRLVNLPDGGGDRRPDPADPIAQDQPLPKGGFRGGLRAELSPAGRRVAQFEADALPLGELAAPVLPRPTPLSGLVSVELKADAAVDSLTDPRAWKAIGRLQGARIAHRSATLDSLAARFSLEGGRLAIPELTAKLAGRPLESRLNAELIAPYGYDGEIKVGNWSLDDLLTLVPGVPQPSPVGGRFTIRADARGTLAPWSIETRGEGHLAKFRAGPIPLGDVPFRWTTGPGEVVVDRIVARPFGGRLEAHARVPRGPGHSAEARINLTGFDASRLAAAMPGRDLKMAGIADIRVTISAQTEPRAGSPSLEAEATLDSTNLTVQGVPARTGHGSLSIREGVVTYEVETDARDSRVRLGGEARLATAPGGGGASQAHVQAGWFSLEDIVKARGLTGLAAGLKGTCAFSARVTAPQDPARRSAHAVGEARGLRWRDIPLGGLKADAVVAPDRWQVRSLSGNLLGSPIHGQFWRDAGGPGPPLLGGRVTLERIELARLAAFLPGHGHAQDFRGHASLSLEGHRDKATAEIRVVEANLFGFPLSELHVPAEIAHESGSGAWTVHIRRSSANLAGGLIGGEALVHFGARQGGHAELSLNNVDLKAFRWINANDRRPTTGKVSGKVKIDELDTARVERTRGRAHLDLTDASLFELPVFRQVDQFLGSELGGIFESGELDATIVGGQFKVDRLALAGRLIQVRARGTVGFDGALDLDVLVKRNQVLSQAGRAVASTILDGGSSTRGGDSKVLETSKPLANGPVKLRISGTFQDTRVVADPTMTFVE